jgi:uncharacterized protein
MVGLLYGICVSILRGMGDRLLQTSLKGDRKLLLIVYKTYNQGMEFEWDEIKAAINLNKHGINFEEAKTVFYNPLAVIFDDEKHSQDERREIIIGHSQNNQLLLVSYTERGNAIRIISARLATRKEREDYEENAF